MILFLIWGIVEFVAMMFVALVWLVVWTVIGIVWIVRFLIGLTTDKELTRLEP